MKLIGKFNNVYLIQDPNRGINTFWFGSDVQDYFVINKLTKINNVVLAQDRYKDVRTKQQTSSSRLMVPLDLDHSKIEWIAGGSDNVEMYIQAYQETI